MNLNEIIEIIPANVFYCFLGMCSKKRNKK
jgi:hypothetical protein